MASTVNLPNLVPQFPAEIWGIVFSNLDPTDQELVHLWLDYRFVSKLFKEEIEHLFAKKIIQKTSLLIGSGTPEIHRDSTAREKLSISWWDGLSYSGSFTFEKFSEQRHRAVFRCDRPSDSYTSNLFQTLKDQELLQNVMTKPYHQMSMRQRINHIPLPDLIVDVVEHTLALDWRQLLSRFFAEEKKKKDVVGTSWTAAENEKNHTTIGSALLGIEPNMSNITPPTMDGKPSIDFECWAPSCM